MHFLLALAHQMVDFVRFVGGPIADVFRSLDALMTENMLQQQLMLRDTSPPSITPGWPTVTRRGKPGNRSAVRSVAS